MLDIPRLEVAREYWLPTPFASFPFTSPPVRHRVPPGSERALPIVQEAGWASGPVWTGEENLAPTGFRSPDRPAPRQSLYRLSYPAHREL